MREPLSPTELLSRLTLAVQAEKGLPADSAVSEAVLEAYRLRLDVASQLAAGFADLDVAIHKVVGLATEGLGRVDGREQPPAPVTATWLAVGERLMFVQRRVLDLAAEAWIDPLGVRPALTPGWDLASCTVSRVLGSRPGVVGTEAAYTDTAVLQFLRIQALVVLELARASLHDLLTTYARLAGGPVAVEGESAAERVRHLRVRRPLGEPLEPGHLGPLAEAWLASVAPVVAARPASDRAAHKRERWLADDARRFRKHLEVRQKTHVRRLKDEARRLRARGARIVHEIGGIDSRARRLPPPT